MAEYDYPGPGADWGVGSRQPGPDVSHRSEQEPAGLAPPALPRHNGGPGNQGGRQPVSPALSPDNTDTESRRSGERNQSRPRGSRSTSGQVRTCKKCGESLTGQFVRALDGTFHLDCFRCRVSSPWTASRESLR